MWSVVQAQAEAHAVVAGRAQDRLQRFQLVDDGCGILDLVPVSGDMFFDGADDFDGARGLEPATARPAHGRGVELHVFGERFGFRLAEGDELAQAAKIFLVGDGVEGVPLRGEGPAVEVARLDPLDLPFEDDDEAEAQGVPQIFPSTRAKFPPRTSSRSGSE